MNEFITDLYAEEEYIATLPVSEVMSEDEYVEIFTPLGSLRVSPISFNGRLCIQESIVEA